jgi:protein gp37
MSAASAIEWTESTWNPVTGCTKLSPGCAHCYAERMARRLKAMGQPNYAHGFDVTLHEAALELPSQWRKPQMIFVNSMSDLFHEDIPTEFILRVFEVMNRAGQHVYQILTKRSKRLLEMNALLPWAENVWMGVTVENGAFTSRVEDLRQTSAMTKFLSLEPLLGPLPDLHLDGIDWVIVGGESGPGARPMESSWVVDIRDQCRKAAVPFFFKQWGGVHKKRAGRILEGRTWSAMPSGSRIRTA